MDSEKTIKRVAAALAERETRRATIFAAITQTEQGLTAARAERDATRVGMAEAQVDGILNQDAAPAPTGRTLEAYREAADKVESLSALLEGLQARLQSDDVQVLAMQAELTEAHAALVDEQLKEFNTEYLKAAQVFAKVCRKGLGLGMALGVDMGGLSELRITDPQFPLQTVVELVSRVYSEGTWVNRSLDDPSIRSTYERFSFVSETRYKMAAVARECQTPA
jgi:hypothetical protein